MTASEALIGIENSAHDEGEKDRFFIRNNHVLIRVKLTDIQWISAEGNYCYIHTGSRKYAVKISMKKLASRLPRREFAQIHKSYIVRLDCIETVDTKENFLRISETNLPLGRIYKEGLISQLDVL